MCKTVRMRNVSECSVLTLCLVLLVLNFSTNTISYSTNLLFQLVESCYLPQWRIVTGTTSIHTPKLRVFVVMYPSTFSQIGDTVSEMETWLQRKTSKKSHTAYRMAPIPMTLRDNEDQFSYLTPFQIPYIQKYSVNCETEVCVAYTFNFHIKNSNLKYF